MSTVGKVRFAVFLRCFGVDRGREGGREGEEERRGGDEEGDGGWGGAGKRLGSSSDSAPLWRIRV